MALSYFSILIHQLVRFPLLSKFTTGSSNSLSCTYATIIIFLKLQQHLPMSTRRRRFIVIYRRYIFRVQGSKFYLIFVYHSTETYSSELFYKRMNLAKPYESECEDASAFYYTKLGSLTVLPLDNPKRN